MIISNYCYEFKRLTFFEHQAPERLPTPVGKPDAMVGQTPGKNDTFSGILV